MEAAIFIFYLLIFIFFVSSISFFKNSGINKWKLIALYVIKILAGIAYATFYKLPKYYRGSDTWRFYRLSLNEKQWLLKDPIAFIKDLFVYGYDKAGNVFEGKNSYWNDLKSNIPVKMMAVMNVITNNSYYTNIIIFNLLFLFGLVALFKFFNSIFPGKKNLIIIGIFLLPSALFWCSGIHKDGLILSALGLIIYNVDYANRNRISISRILLIAFCFLLIFSLRNYIAIALLPALFCWWWSNKMSNRKWLPFLIIYTIGIILFFGLKLIFPTLDFPNYIVEKQIEFSQLEGNSVVIHHLLQPTLISFLNYLPSAIDMAFFRPHITEAKNFSYIPAALENVLLIIVLIVSIFFRDKQKPLSSATIFCLVFSVSILLLSGYTITLSGAIVRYRSIALPLLITPLLCLIRFNYSRFLNRRNEAFIK